jgi:hypothetical protein
MPLTRRSLLQISIAAAAPLAAPGASTAGRASSGTHDSLDPDTDAGRAFIFRKLAYATDDTVGYWWLEGTRYGLVDSELTPFWQIHIGNLFRVHELPGGDYEVDFLSVSFYTDVNSGQYLQKFVNPYTHKTIDIGYYPPKVVTVHFGADGDRNPVTDADGITHTDAIGAARIEGDRIWVQADRLLHRDAAAPKGPVRVNDLCTYFGSTREVANPHDTMPAAGLMFTDINAWPTWLDMGDRPGSYYSRMLGQKVSTYQQMPALWRTLLAQEHPDIARDPARMLARSGR